MRTDSLFAAVWTRITFSELRHAMILVDTFTDDYLLYSANFDHKKHLVVLEFLIETVVLKRCSDKKKLASRGVPCLDEECKNFVDKRVDLQDMVCDKLLNALISGDHVLKNGVSYFEIFDI